MLIFTFALLISLCAALLFLKWWKMKMFWKKKGIPHCPVHPIFGSLTFLQKINPFCIISNHELRTFMTYGLPPQTCKLMPGLSEDGSNVLKINCHLQTLVAIMQQLPGGIYFQHIKLSWQKPGQSKVGIWMRDIYKQYPSPYVGIWVFWRPGLIINCPKLARNILVKDFDNFRNRLLGTGKNDELGTLNLFTADDPLWTLVRKRLTNVFTTSKLKSWQDLYRSKAKDLVFRIRSDNEKGIKIDLKPFYSDYTTDIIGESAFGIKCEATKNTVGPLRAMTKEFEKYSVFRGIEWSSIFFFPELADLLRFTFWPRNSTAYFTKVFNMIVQERGGYEKKTDGKRDLLDALLKLKQDVTNDNQSVDEVVLISNALIFLQGGYDTSSNILAYVTYELAHQPQYQERVYEELMELKSKIGDKEFEESELASLPLFNAVLKETFRKYPAMGWIDRLALNDYKVDEHLSIPAGTVVYVNATGMHNDPKLFPDPEEFKPERFLPENEKNITPYSYLPFGEGPRMCIGMRFALYTLRFGLAALITNFTMKPLPNTPVPNDVSVEHKGMFYMPGETISVEFAPRN